MVLNPETTLVARRRHHGNTISITAYQDTQCDNSSRCYNSPSKVGNIRDDTYEFPIAISISQTHIVVTVAVRVATCVVDYATTQAVLPRLGTIPDMHESRCSAVSLKRNWPSVHQLLSSLNLSQCHPKEPRRIPPRHSLRVRWATLQQHPYMPPSPSLSLSQCRLVHRSFVHHNLMRSDRRLHPSPVRPSLPDTRLRLTFFHMSPPPQHILSHSSRRSCPTTICPNRSSKPVRRSMMPT